MYLTKIEIKSFKKVAVIEMQLAPVNMIIGGNNSGKSSVLQAIHTAVSAAQTQMEQGGLKAFAEETLRYSPSSDFASLGHGTPFGNRWDQNRAKIKFYADDDVDGEPKELNYTIELYKGRNPRVVGVDRSGSVRLGSQLYSLDSPFSVYVPGLAGVPHFEELKAQPVVLRKIAGGEANLVLRNVIWQIQQRDLLRELISNLRRFFPGIDIATSFDPSRDTTIDIQVRPSQRDGYYSIELCGTGVLQAIQIFAYVVLYKPTLLLLDEPDAHLHPTNQVKLLEAVKFLSLLYGTKTLIATHSRHLMSAARSTAKFFWLDEGRIKEQGEFELAEVLMDIGGLDDADLILNSQKEFLIFAEDKNKKPLKNLLSYSGIDDSRFDIISYLGVSNADALAKILNSLKPFVRGNRKIIVHRDRDFCEDRELEPFIRPFEALGIKVFVTLGSDIESYFLNIYHLSEVSNKPADEVEQLINDCLEKYDEEIRQSFKNKRQEINRMPINRDGDNTPTRELLPDDERVEIKHVVGKDFCTMFRKYTVENSAQRIDPMQRSGVVLAPDLVKVLES